MIIRGMRWLAVAVGVNVLDAIVIATHAQSSAMVGMAFGMGFLAGVLVTVAVINTGVLVELNDQIERLGKSL